MENTFLAILCPHCGKATDYTEDIMVDGVKIQVEASFCKKCGEYILGYYKNPEPVVLIKKRWWQW